MVPREPHHFSSNEGVLDIYPRFQRTFFYCPTDFLFFSATFHHLLFFQACRSREAVSGKLESRAGATFAYLFFQLSPHYTVMPEMI